MVAWEIKGVGGMLPRTDDRLIGDNMAVEAVNCDMTGGQLVGLPQLEFEIDLSGYGTVERAYRYPPMPGYGEVWLPLPSRYSSVVRSPVANDSFNRIYWTNPGDLRMHFNTHDRIAAGQPPMDAGIPQPTSPCSIVSVTGGTTDPNQVLPEDRSYCYTFVNIYNEESSPSPASATVSGPPDATWTVTGWPTSAPGNPGGVNFPAVNRFNLYRTIVSQTSGAQFYLVAQFNFPCGATFADTIPGSTVAENEVLESTGWGNAPDYLDGLTAMPGGFLVGFMGKTVHFSEPNRPHTWPDIYDQSAHYPIVNIAVWQQYLVVLTQGYPLTGSGNMPSNIVLVQTQVPEPCIARGSVIVDTIGVFYASHNGLVQLTGYGIQNVTAMIVEKNEWLGYYQAEHLVSCRHRSQYMAVNGTNKGFLIDYAETRLGVQDLSTLNGVVCIWNDEHTGDTLVCAGGMIWEWDCPTTPPQTYRWKSKQFFTIAPISLGAAQVTLDHQVYGARPPPEPLDNGDTRNQLPAGINAMFKYYAGPGLQLIMTRNLTKQMEIFRLPSGFKAFDHQVEVVSCVPIASIQLATTLEELKQT